MFSRGDGAWDHNPSWSGNGGRGLRGMFVGGQNGAGRRSFRDVTDGMSNTIAMGERIKAQPGGVTIESGAIARNIPQASYRANASLCLNNMNPTVTNQYSAGVGRWAGTRWMDGAPNFTGMSTILGPNKPSCTDGGGDDRDGIQNPSSKHTGGAQVLMGDGAVRFISDNINTGDPTRPTPVNNQERSPYGVFGALGSVQGGETIGDF